MSIYIKTLRVHSCPWDTLADLIIRQCILSCSTILCRAWSERLAHRLATNPKYGFSEVSPIMVNGAYFQVNINSISQVGWWQG